MKPSRHPPLRPDILHLAQDNLGTADQVTVFGELFDAAIRATHTMSLNDPRRNEMLNHAMDTIYGELTRQVLVQAEREPEVLQPGRAGGARLKAPALKP